MNRNSGWSCCKKNILGYHLVVVTFSCCGQRCLRSLDGWTWTYTPIWNSIQETYPSTAPLVLGGMGYSGRTGQFVPSRVLDRAYLEKGIALDYYRGFDASWQDAREYFDPRLGSSFRTVQSGDVRDNSWKKQPKPKKIVEQSLTLEI